uniref:Uncharacterized protein MANES_15G058300 n=2 Tax=Rhizophora mucronata TaxID=61149 RepID=A0A2P2JYR3_RHIMU
MKRSFTRCNATRLSQLSPLRHSLHSMHARESTTFALFVPLPTSSMSNTLTGHFFFSSSAISSSISSSNTTSGNIRYQAVATGDHFACVLPMPLTACASSSISCPGPSLAIIILSSVRPIGLLENSGSESWLRLNEV